MYRPYWLFALLLSLVGCGAAYDGSEPHFVGGMEQASTEAAGTEADVFAKTEEASGDGSSGDGAQSDGEQAAALKRKIIYTASVELVVKDFGETERQIAELVSQMGGYVSEFSEDRRYGGQLGGTWEVRIPTSKFNAFLDQVLEFGMPMMRQLDAQDVTEQFVDLTARLKNKRRLEERVLALLENQTAGIKDVIEVEQQLARVREEIEVLEGKLRYLTDRVDMTTVTISAREDQNYIPPQAPSFTTKIKEVFSGSITALKVFAQGVTLAIVAIAPWFALLCLVLIPLVILFRRRRR